MTDAELLVMLKTDLGMSTTAYDARLLQYIASAKAEITRAGITLNDSIEDASGIVMYAAWFWRRRDTMEGMSPMLRFWLHSRLTDEKMGVNHG